MNSENKTIVFCDGASSGNPGPGGWGAIVSYPNKKEFLVTELGGGDKRTTNNRMELSAAIGALKFLSDIKNDIVVYTDSSYVINGITKWVFGWQSRNWQTQDKKDVSNRELWEELVILVRGKKISWCHIDGHSGIPGNERADEIATGFSLSKPPMLFSGKKSGYSVEIDNITRDEKKYSEKKRSGGKAHSYLSLVDGNFCIDQTWAECEKRVKGKAGAKFRKSLSVTDEEDIKKIWGVK
ncbi:MAG: ribonuclease HI [bacterium]